MNEFQHKTKLYGTINFRYAKGDEAPLRVTMADGREEPCLEGGFVESEHKKPFVKCHLSTFEKHARNWHKQRLQQLRDGRIEHVRN